MSDFSIRMTNTLQFSRCEALDKPLPRGGTETLHVALRDDLLTISDTGLFDFDDPTQRAFAANFRIYARRTGMSGADMTFKLLAKAPLPDVLHFSVIERDDNKCVVTTGADGRRTLNAWGSDDGDIPTLLRGRMNCRGWIFNAREVP